MRYSRFSTETNQGLRSNIHFYPPFISFRLFFALAYTWYLDTLEMMDVDTAFLNAPLDDPIFIKVPEGMQRFLNIPAQGYVVLKLKKSVYGLNFTFTDFQLIRLSFDGVSTSNTTTM